ncbi:hypothetical protein NGH30_10305 [Macrococcus caseolyticus]|uniref:hypothetical protein n=1 Tax=Macrococcoides caseolyticum TaxID=69966 RepID=UPI000C32FAE9|nr:hypothetical protein [Macrococcus caseolyticus]MEB8172204.1 hypothetical protein [Macrococcus caseolyticus]PKE25120.1 hypothetical protein CW689_01255 [Macrococcus caseolyticus]
MNFDKINDLIALALENNASLMIICNGTTIKAEPINSSLEENDYYNTLEKLISNEQNQNPSEFIVKNAKQFFNYTNSIDLGYLVIKYESIDAITLI